MGLIPCIESHMTERQKLSVRRSEIRQRLAELGGVAEPTSEQLGEIDTLSTEYSTSEQRHRALLIAEDTETREHTEDSQGRELRQLVERANLGGIVTGVLSGSGTDGAEREIQQHFNMGADQVPLAMLEQRETRAAATAQAPGNVGRNQHEITPVVFPQSAAAFMGVEQPTVTTGEQTYPVMTAPTAHKASVDDGTTVDDETGTFTADNLSPRRLQASFTYSIEDEAAFAGMDEALRMNLSDRLSSSLDWAILRTTDAGLLDFGADPTNPTNVATFADYQSAILGDVDGRYANGAVDVRVLMGPKTYEHAGSVYRTTNSETSALDRVMQISGGVRVSAHVAAPASNVQQAVTARAVGLRHAVAPIWDGIRLQRDPFTESKDGNIRLTGIMLYAFKILRTDGYNRHAFKLA